MTEVTLILWRDIPAQLVARNGRRTAKRELPSRFAEAIDRAAMRGGARDEDAYLAGWRRAPLGDHEGDPDTAIAAHAARIEAEYDAARLATLIAAGGRA